ncbi:MAG: 16S rRNA (guanine(527)-N(7))-methyltransferase RsmG [Thermodesulfovibrionales bacterium]|nr:16S rRNA (guanine(527)-N(7))-methyltransferase RsmG [Thermodesulfovibrionales bacterium]
MPDRRLLREGLGELGIVPSEGQVDSFMAYLSEIKKWNMAYNLTSLKTDEDIIIKHFLDSCLYLSALPEGVLRLADVGSGAGFPGIPLKIIRPKLDVSLIEPSRKKSAFLRHIIRRLGLQGIEVIGLRVEDVSGEPFDAAVTRALFSVEEFIRKSARLVKKGGLLIVSKGPRAKEELKGIKADYEVITLGLPMTDIKRQMIIIKVDGR